MYIYTVRQICFIFFILYFLFYIFYFIFFMITGLKLVRDLEDLGAHIESTVDREQVTTINIRIKCQIDVPDI
jgi:hypothetical protein